MSSVTGTAEVIHRLRAIADKAPQIVAEPALSTMMLRRVLRRFDAAQAPSGALWPALMEETILSKKRKGYQYPERPLFATGGMRESIKVIKTAGDRVLAGATGLGFRVGITNRAKGNIARIHNYGYGVERRQFIGVSVADIAAVRAFVLRRLKSISETGE